MEARDFVVTPLLILLVFLGAYHVRPLVTDSVTRRYFLPALAFRVVGALALGLLYQFYYSGGDTFNYHTHGSRIIWEVLLKDPLDGLRLIFGSTDTEAGVYQYTSRILFFHDPNTYFVIRFAAFFDIITFSSYTGTAVLFSLVSFTGMWMLFTVFYKQYPHLHLGLAIATCFIPSVIFWGSGLLKDTLVIGFVGMSTYFFYRVFMLRKATFLNLLALLCCLLVIYKIRIFVLQALLPSLLIWLFAFHFKQIRSMVVRIVTVPLVSLILLVSVYFAVSQLGQLDKRYSLSNLTTTSRKTAYDIGFYTGRDAGSHYSLQVDEWTPAGMLRAAPAAINVSLFRPYPWEVRNILMAISAAESFFLMIFTAIVIMQAYSRLWRGITNFNTLFCLLFSMAFAFAAGISTFNFGTLTRYRVAFLPFYLIALIILRDYAKSERKLEALESTE